jgi:tetratricopeptide (TPR) repeat protein
MKNPLANMLSTNLYTLARSTKAQLTLGNAYIERSQYFEALDIFHNILAQDSSQAKAYNSLGHIYFCLGQVEDALKMFKQAVNLDVKLVLAYQNLGYTYCDLGSYPKAISAFRRGIELEPGNARLHYGIGLVYAICDDQVNTLACLRAASVLDPTYVGPRITLANLYQTLGNILEYKMQIQSSIPLMTGQRAYTYAKFAAACGNIEETLDWLECAIDQSHGYRWTARYAYDFRALQEHRRFQQLTHIPT